MIDYALYHGDKYLTAGSKQYLANWLGVKIRTIYFYLSPTYKRRTNYQGYYVIRLEDDEEECNYGIN